MGSEATNGYLSMSMLKMAKSRPINRRSKSAPPYQITHLIPLSNRYRRDLEAQFGLTIPVLNQIYARDSENVD